MDRINHPTAEDRQFTGGNPQAGIPPTRVTAAWLNNVQEELCRAIEGAGLTLDPENQDQLQAAIQALVATTEHEHAIADTTGLQTALDGKAPTSHAHTAADLPTASEAAKGVVQLAGAALAKALADATRALTPADLAAVVGDHAGFPGFKNAVINGGCRVAQRGAGTLSNSYVFGKVDRFACKADGTVGAGSITQLANNASYKSGYALHLSGVTLSGGSEKLYIRHRIESRDCARFCNKAANFACEVYHDFGIASNFVVTVNKANAQDDFSAVTNIATGGAQSVPNTTLTDVVLAVADMGNCLNGIEVIVRATTGAITAKNLYASAFQLEPGAVRTTFEARPVGLELDLCQRYFQKSYRHNVAPGNPSDWEGCENSYGTTTNGNWCLQARLAPRMRTSPTVTVYNPRSGATGSADNQGTAAARATSGGTISDKGFRMIPSTADSGDANYLMGAHWTADAEL